MKNKYLLLIAFIIVAAVQLYIPASMIYDNEYIIKTGKDFKFKTAPIDPNDPFRGKYITLDFDHTSFKTTDTLQFERGDDVFVFLYENQDGFAEIENLSKVPPEEHIDYVKAKIGYVRAQNDTAFITINYPFKRYYMEEFKAPEAEKIYADAQVNSSITAYALVKINEGEAVLTDVIIDGTSINDLVETGKAE